jgi:hypothetical protein
MVMCGSPTFDLHGALHVASAIGAEIEALDEDGHGPVVTGMQINVPARTIIIGVGTPADLREAHRRLGIETTDLMGQVSMPLARGFKHDGYGGWAIEVYGPAGLTVIR